MNIVPEGSGKDNRIPLLPEISGNYNALWFYLPAGNQEVEDIRADPRHVSQGNHHGLGCFMACLEPALNGTRHPLFRIMIQDNLYSHVRGVIVDHIRGLAIHDHQDFVHPAAEEIFHAPIHNPFSAHSLAQFLPPESVRQSRAK
jgi:hypothetical protein